MRRVIKAKDIPNSVAKQLLEQRLNDDTPPTEQQRITYEYLTKFSKLKPEVAEELVEKLVSEFLISRATAVQIANIVPKSIEELRTILAPERRVFTKEDLEKMLSIVNEAASK